MRCVAIAAVAAELDGGATWWGTYGCGRKRWRRMHDDCAFNRQSFQLPASSSHMSCFSIPPSDDQPSPTAGRSTTLSDVPMQAGLSATQSSTRSWGWSLRRRARRSLTAGCWRASCRRCGGCRRTRQRSWRRRGRSSRTMLRAARWRSRRTPRSCRSGAAISCIAPSPSSLCIRGVLGH